MNSIQEINKLKADTETISQKARLDKAGVDSLMRQRDRLKAKKYLYHRLSATHIVKLDEQIDKAEIEAGKSWAKLESHRIHIDILRSYHSTKREELKQGL